MTKDMWDWESKAHYVPVTVVVVIQRVHPEDQLHTQTGFIEKDSRLSLPEAPLSETETASKQVRSMIKPYVQVDPQWVHVHFVGFFDSLDQEMLRTIRLVYKLVVPDNIEVNDTLKWMTYNELARTTAKIDGNHDRIFAAAFNG